MAQLIGPARECGQKAQAEAHSEHEGHVCDAGGVKAQRLVESICILPNPKRASDTGKRVCYGDVWHRRKGEPAALVACVCGPARECGGRRRMRERTANILLMPVTLEVLKLSGWLKAAACKEFEYACCRVRSGSPTQVNACGTEMCHRGKRGNQQRARRACGPAREWGQKRRTGGSAPRTFCSCL